MLVVYKTSGTFNYIYATETDGQSHKYNSTERYELYQSVLTATN